MSYGSSWLSGGLSQFSSLTDQISSFTKDVLTETTEEIEDPAAELQVARKKIDQLEEINNHYKTEWEKLQRHSEEVSERAETSECQIAAISQEYRKLIQEKDRELRRLRSEAVNLKEQQRKFVSDGEASLSPLKELAGGKRFFTESEGGRRERREGGGEGDEGAWDVAVLEPVAVVEGVGWEEGDGEGVRGEGEGWREYHDFGDVISSQGEINRLQLELSKLQVETKHWRTLAEEKGHTSSSGPMEAVVASLREQIEDLQLCLQRERGQHQHELSALEAEHNQKLHSFSQSSRTGTEPEEGHLERGSQDAVSVGGRVGTATSETVRESLLSGLEEVSLDERDGDGCEERGTRTGTVVASLQTQLEESREKCVRLEAELEQLRTQLTQSQDERREERDVVKDLQSEVRSLKTRNAALEGEKTSARLAVMESQVETLRGEMRQLEEENARLLAGEQRAGVLQMELSDTQSTNEKLKTSLQQKETEKLDLNHMISQLNNSLDLQKETTRQLHSQVELLKCQFAQERDTYTQHTEREKENLSAIIAELQASVSEHEECVTRLRMQCENSQEQAESLSTQIVELVAEVQSKDHQLNTALQRNSAGGSPDQEHLAGSELRESVQRTEGSSVHVTLEAVTEERDQLLMKVGTAQAEVQDITRRLLEERKSLENVECRLREVTSRNTELVRSVEEARSELGDVRNERAEMVERVGVAEEEARAAREESAAKQAECSKLAKQLEHLKAHLMQVEEQYVQDALQAEAREREERQRAERLQETLRNASYTGQQENLQTKAQVAALEEQLHTLAAQRDEAVMQLSSAREETENSATALRNLQSVLEQFQRDQSSELSVALKRSQTELATALSEREALKSHNVKTERQLQEARAGECTLRQQLQEQETRLEKLQQEVTGLRATLHSTEEALERLMRDEGGRVDQNLVKNLVMGYVAAPNRKKSEVLILIAKILNFSAGELEQVQGRRSGWFSGLWGHTPPSPALSPIQSGSLSQLFVSFLESESSPSSLPSRPLLLPPPPGRVDSHTDPDRPSRATAANMLPSLSLSTASTIFSHPSSPSNTLPLATPSHTNPPGLSNTGITPQTSTDDQPATPKIDLGIITTPLPPPVSQVLNPASKPRPEQKTNSTLVPSQRHQFSILNELLSTD